MQSTATKSQSMNATQSPEVISIKNLSVRYDQHLVLEDINLSVNHRDFIGLIGPNGGGKTTLLKVLLGLAKPATGRIKILNKNIRRGRRHIGYVPQLAKFDRDFPINVWEVVRMGRLGKRPLLKNYTAKDDEVVAKVLQKVEMWHLRARPIGELSGGQQQRTYIARALASEPEILLLDEPTASIDPQMSASIYDLLEKLNESITILMVSHDMGAISSHVKSIGCLNRRLYYHGQKLLTPEMLEEAYQCPVELIAHGVPHRVFPEHS